MERQTQTHTTNDEHIERRTERPIS